MEGILVPIFICCVLPIAIVFIIFGSSVSQKRTNAKVLMEALRHVDHVDVNRLADQLNMKENRKNDPVSTLHRRLLHGCVGTLSGIGLASIIPLLSEPGPLEMSDTQIFLALCAIISFCIGIGNLVVYFVTRKQVPRNRDNRNGYANNRILPGE